jgi:hypothetical protein
LPVREKNHILAQSKFLSLARIYEGRPRVEADTLNTNGKNPGKIDGSLTKKKGQR